MRLVEEEDVMRHVEEQEQLRRVKDRAYLRKCAVLVVVILLVIMSIVILPSISRERKKMEKVRALSNSKPVYFLLSDFEADYGHFPDDSSAASQPELNNFHGSYSNDYLGQLLADGYTTSEEIFYAYDKRYGRKKADNVVATLSRILEKNECGFSYVLVEERGKIRGLSMRDLGSLPLLAAPLVNEWGSFEKKSYKGEGVCLRVDGSARSERLRAADQKIELSPGGPTLFDSGPGTIWGSRKPVVLLPER